MNRLAARRLPVLLGAVLLAAPAHAWLRAPHEDAQLVERSELIAVARLKRGSIVCVPHPRKRDEGRSREYHATLALAKVLKGTCRETELPIIIHYGLTPVVGGREERDGFMINLSRGRKDYPKGIIEIVDTGSSVSGGGPLVKDAGEDNLWFLRRRSGRFGRKPGTGKLGIVEPEDLQPLELRDYFLAYLSADPERAVKEHIKTTPAIAERAQRFLDHCELQRILKLDSPKARLERLLPYYIKRAHWGLENEARRGIVACGTMAGPHLRKLFEDPKHRALRTDIILLWGEIRYDGCVPVLTDLLKAHDKFWAAQTLDKGWWNADVGTDLTRERRERYGEVYYGVVTLGRLGDGRAREAIELTRRRWEAINFSNPQIVEACTEALKAMREP